MRHTIATAVVKDAAISKAGLQDWGGCAKRGGETGLRLAALRTRLGRAAAGGAAPPLTSLSWMMRLSSSSTAWDT